MKADIIVAGGGASGLVAAIMASRNGKKVLILEHKDQIGKKILATGNGKCNYTNLNQDPSCYRGEDSAYALRVLSQFGLEDTISFFKELGIYPKSKKGYLYPNSEQASSVLDVLRLELEHHNVQILCGEHVSGIQKKNGVFLVKTNQHSYESDKVILASGGMAASDLGSDGSGYSIAKAFGHTIVKPVPALVQLKAAGNYFKMLSGVRTDVSAKLYDDGREIAKSAGELQLTSYGVSGIPIFEISRYAARALQEKRKVTITFDFIKELSEEDMILLMKKRISDCRYKSVEDIFLGLLNKKLSYVLIREAGIDVKGNAAKLSEIELVKLIKKIKNFSVTINETNPFSNAQVSAGGVSTKEVNPETMESRLEKGFYLTGELLDIDGTCGGYNLQWAWSTGWVAGVKSSR